MKDIELELETKEFRPNVEFTGTVTINFPGRYDGVVINTQILDSNELVTFRSYNGKKTSQNMVARLFVNKDAIPQNKIQFTAILEFNPKQQEHEIKFRASIIEQHKEIESVIVFGRLLAS